MKFVVAAFVCASIAISTGVVRAEDPASLPEGIEAVSLASTDLGRHFESMKGKNLKMWRFVIAPHVSSGKHGHQGNPEVVYVLKGSIVEHQGPDKREYHAGEAFVSNTDLRYPHWVENTGDVPTELLATEVEDSAIGK